MIAMISLGQFLIPGLVIFLVIGILLGIKVFLNRYQKIPPNQVAIIYGRGTRVNETGLAGCKVVSGGGVFVWPVFQTMDVMNTSVFKVPIEENKIVNKDNVPISVRGVAMCKISNTPEDLQSAAMNFLGQDPKDIEDKTHEILTGHVRSIIGKLDINGVLRDRDAFNKMVVEESTTELKRMGLQIVTLVIQEVNDELGYIDALGKKAVAEAMRDANIKVAEAEAETTKKVSTTKKDAAVVEAQNAVAVAAASKDRDVQVAEFKVLTEQKNAVAEQAKAIAVAAQQETLKVAEAKRDAAAAEAQIAVQEKEALRMERELIVTTIKPAEAQRNASIISADGQRQAAIIVAEANKQTAVIEADGAKQAAILKADADKAVAVRQAEGEAEAAETLGKGQAAQTLATRTAEAEGAKLNMLAQATGKQAGLMAEAEGNAALKGKVLLAEAEATLKLAEAYKALTDSGRLIYILQNIKPLVEAGGDAGAKIMQAIFSPVAAGLANIDSINITDLGGTGRGVEQMANVVPNTVFGILAKCKTMGIDLSGLLAKAGVNTDELMKMIGKNSRSADEASEKA